MEKMTFHIPISDIPPDRVEEMLAELRKTLDIPATRSFISKENGDVAEYDQFMGLWYVKGKENCPYARHELEDTEKWEPAVELWFPVTEEKHSLWTKILRKLKLKK